MKRVLMFLLCALCTAAACSADLPASAATERVEKEEGENRLAVIMYHNTVPDNYKASTYVIRVGALERDFRFLKENGYNVMSSSAIIDAVKNGVALPKKSVMLTFDDGYLFNKNYALPLLEKYRFTALFAIVGEYTKLNKTNPNVSKTYTYLDFEDVAQLKINSCVEFASHSYNLHHMKGRQGVKIKKYEDEQSYCEMFRRDTMLLENGLAGAGVRPRVYAYPYGAYCAQSERVIKNMGYEMSLTCNEGLNTIENADSLFLLRRFNRSGIGASVSQIFAKYGY